MIDQPTPTPDDDPADAASKLTTQIFDYLDLWEHRDQHDARRVAAIIREHDAPLIASVRELLAEIHPVDGFTDLIPLMQYTTDAIEVVRKERSTTETLMREKQAALDWLRKATNTQYPNAPAELWALAKVAADMLKIAHDGLHEADAIHRDLRKQLATANDQVTDLIQTSGDLCETCGWRGKRGDGCAFCGLVAANAENERHEAECMTALAGAFFPLFSALGDEADEKFKVALRDWATLSNLPSAIISAERGAKTLPECIEQMIERIVKFETDRLRRQIAELKGTGNEI